MEKLSKHLGVSKQTEPLSLLEMTNELDGALLDTRCVRVSDNHLLNIRIAIQEKYLVTSKSPSARVANTLVFLWLHIPKHGILLVILIWLHFLDIMQWSIKKSLKIVI